MKKILICFFSFLFFLAYGFSTPWISPKRTSAEGIVQELGTLCVQQCPSDSIWYLKGVPFMLGSLDSELEGTCTMEQGEISVKLANGTTNSLTTNDNVLLRLCPGLENGFQTVYFKFSVLRLSSYTAQAGDTFVIGGTFATETARFTVPKFTFVFGETHAADRLELVEESSFSMLGGALLRMDGMHNGLRFQAEVGKTPVAGATYYMLIVPERYLTHFGITGNYYEELKRALGDKFLAAMEAEPFQATKADELASGGRLQEGLWYVQGSLTDIQYENLNETFFAVAYYVDGDGEHYASFTVGKNVRSIRSATQNALVDTTKYTEEELTILQSWLEAAEAQESGKSEEEYKAEKSA